MIFFFGLTSWFYLIEGGIRGFCALEKIRQIPQYLKNNRQIPHILQYRVEFRCPIETTTPCAAFRALEIAITNLSMNGTSRYFRCRQNNQNKWHLSPCRLIISKKLFWSVKKEKETQWKWHSNTWERQELKWKQQGIEFKMEQEKRAEAH